MEFDELITQFKAIQLKTVNKTQELILKNLFNEVKINEFCMTLLQEWCKKNKKIDKIVEKQFEDDDFQTFKESVEIAFKIFEIKNDEPKQKEINPIIRPENSNKKKHKIEFIEEEEAGTGDPEKVQTCEKKRKKIGNKFYYMYEGSNKVYDKNNKLLGELIDGKILEN